MSSAIQRVLVGTDLSEGSRVALRRAAQLARQHDAHLELLHVAHAGSVLPDWLVRAQPALADEQELAADLRGRLTAIALEAGIDDTLPFSVEVRFGRSAQVLAERASEIPADLLVVGAQGESGIVETVLGTTAQKVIRLADVPVLVARKPADTAYREVMLSTDFSIWASAAARFAVVLAPDARFEVFHAYDVPFFTMMTHSGVTDDAMGDYRRMALEDAQLAMSAHLDELGPPLTRASTLFRHGYAPPLIRQHVAEQGTDLVVVGAQGKGAIGRSLLGSVSSHVLLELQCDVLVVKRSA